MSPILAGGFFTTGAIWEAPICKYYTLYKGLENPRIWITSQGGQQYRNSSPPVLRGDCILISHRETIFI